jgi:hypothetical protein
MANLVWTKSVLASIKRDNLTQNIIYDVINDAHKTSPGKIPGSTMYQKTFDYGTISAVAKYGDNGELVVISSWLKQPMGSHHKVEFDPRFKNLPLWKRILLDLAKIIGL